MSTRSHWENVYSTKHADEVSWYQAHPILSLDLIRATGVAKDARIVDVGGGASRLVDYLLEEDYRRVTVLDVAESALAVSRTRLGPAAECVEWLVADVTQVQPHDVWDVWHDRAVFHFLTTPAARAAYRRALLEVVPGWGHVIVATFGPDGPVRCSGLDVVRYSPHELAAEMGPGLQLLESREENHCTPGGTTQAFVYCRFCRVAFD
jgi:SAM-dependent methyltransferase